MTAPTRLGHDEGHHFFGYHDVTPWDPTGRFVLAHRVDEMTGPLDPGQTAEVGMFDLEDDGAFERFGFTGAWNWQMGSRLQWTTVAGDAAIVHNDRPRAASNRIGSVVRDASGAKQHYLPLPVAAVAPTGERALSVDFLHLAHTHPTIGYPSRTPPQLQPEPERAGISLMGLVTGHHDLVLSLWELAHIDPSPSMAGAVHWVSHLEVNPSSDRMVFLHRWSHDVEHEHRWGHRLFTASLEGDDLYVLEHSEPQPVAILDDPELSGTLGYERDHQISHPTWTDDGHIVAWSPHEGAMHVHRYTDRSDEVSAIGEGSLTQNGHMATSPDGRWLLTDTYPAPETSERTLILYDLVGEQRHDIGRFHADPALGKVARCDLHPRFDPSGTRVCIDSVHEGERQMYVVDLSGIVA